MRFENYKYWIKIGLNVTYYGKSCGLTQLELAEISGISRNYIKKIDGGNSASIDTFMNIANAMDVHLYKLFQFVV